jgi:hypothetical protein
MSWKFLGLLSNLRTPLSSLFYIWAVRFEGNARAPHKALEGVHTSEGPWRLSFMSFTANLPLATHMHICLWEVQDLNFWNSFWFSSSAPGSCQVYIISLSRKQFPCKSCPVHHSPVIFPWVYMVPAEWSKIKKSHTLKFQSVSSALYKTFRPIHNLAYFSLSS